jgi:hypothetical protein
MERDQANMGADDLTPAIDMVRSDASQFVNNYFLPSSLLQSRG